MEINYYLADDTITREDRKALAQWLNSDPSPRLTMGTLVQKYEQKWSDRLVRKHSLSCATGSDANMLMYATLLYSGKLKNKKVIVPSAAWNTTISPTMQLGFEPIMCEADQFNFGLDPYYLRGLLHKHNPATVMLVHVLGIPANMEEIMRLKSEFGFFLLEDTCAAMGSTYRGQKLGTFGDMASNSTYYGHQTPTVEGGMVFTDDEDFWNLLLMLRNHGMVTHLDPKKRAELLKKHGIEDIGSHFHHMVPGFNSRFTDILAFIGLLQLDRIEWTIKKRFENHQLYKELLHKYFETQIYGAESTICSIHFCPLAQSYQERNFIIRTLESSGIETRPFTNGNQGLQPYWFTEYGKFSAPTADKLYHCGFFLPNHPYLVKKDIEYICSVAINASIQYRKGEKK